MDIESIVMEDLKYHDLYPVDVLLDELPVFEEQAMIYQDLCVRSAEIVINDLASDGTLHPDLAVELKQRIEEHMHTYGQLAEIEVTKGKEVRGMIKDLVLQTGESVAGESYQAVFSEGRTSWDNKALDGYCIDHPELKQFQKTGNPSVSIRRVNNK